MSMLFKRIKDWATSITSFRTGDVIPVDGPSGTAKMDKNSLLRITATFALEGNLYPAFDHTRTAGNPYKVGERVVYTNGRVYEFVNDHYGAWDGDDVTLVCANPISDIGRIINTNKYSSFNDFPANTSAVVYTDLSDSPNALSPSWGTCLTIGNTATGYKSQIFVESASNAKRNNTLYTRTCRSETWGAWKKIYTEDRLDGDVNAIVAKNSGTFIPRYYNLACDASGALSTLHMKRLSTDLIKIEDFVSVSIDPLYEYKLFLFDNTQTYLDSFGWTSDKVTKDDVITKSASTKYVRMCFLAKNNSDMSYTDSEKVVFELVNVFGGDLSDYVDVQFTSRDTSQFDYVSLMADGLPTTYVNLDRLASREFIPIGSVDSIRSKSSSFQYRLLLYTSNGALASEYIDATAFTSGETSIASVIASYPTAKYFKVMVKKSDGSDLPNNAGVFVEFAKLKKTPVEFERGNLTSVGTIASVTHNATNISNFAKFRTGKFLDICGCKDCKIDLDTDGDCYVYEYDAEFSFIGKTQVTTSVDFSPYTRYIKVMVENSTDMPKMAFWAERKFSTTYNVYSANYISFLYEVANVDPTSIDDSDMDATQYSSTHYFNGGLLRLPPNYSPTGEAVPLIIFNHSSAEFQYRYSQSLNYDSERNYLLKEGYAILDCYGVSSKYWDGETYFVNPGTPDNIACMVGAFEWVTKNYNIDREKVFTMGKSHGCLMTLALAYTKSIPIKAAAFLCPLLNWFEQGVGLGAYSYEHRVVIANQLGFENVGDLDTSALETLYSEDYTTYCLGNVDKMVGNNPFLMGIDGTKAYELTSKSISRTWSDQIFDSSRNCDTPLKVWGASDDGAVVYAQLKSLVTEIKNGKGIAAFRRMPTGTGGHRSVDNDANALKVASIVTKLGYTCTDVPLAYAEVVQWFRRFCG